MSAPPTVLERYLRHRRAWEIAFWVGYWNLNAALNSIVVNIDFARLGRDIPRWEPALWEFSSCWVQLALIPVVLAFDARHPLRVDAWRGALLKHAGFSVVFSLLHIAGMFLIRDLAYRWVDGHPYHYGSLLREVPYEYLKDARTYAGVVALAYLYRFMLLRLQGEARVLAEPDVGPPVDPVDRPERFLVRKLGKEFLVATSDIEWIEAAGNYVNLQVRGRHYPLRSTMAGIEARLDPKRFVRVHRSFIVNLDCVSEIEPTDGGDARLLMRDGAQVPCSRSYRAGLRAAGSDPGEASVPPAVAVRG